MANREEFPAGVPCYIDSGRVDSTGAREFYGGLFGWEYQPMAPDGSYQLATLGGQTVAGLGTQPEQDWTPVWNTYVKVDDADAALAAAGEGGGTVDFEPIQIGPAGRWAAFTDPQGAQLGIWEPDQMPGSQVVNAPGAVVFNTLHTSDLAAAAEFYAAVFGWEMEAEGEQSWMIRLPGYVDVQEQHQPGFKAGMEQMGAPEGFGDVVAQVATGGPPRWEVTFAVEDADAAAGKVSELGGEIVSPPADAPWVRETVVRDSDGAQMVLSQFVPPES